MFKNTCLNKKKLFYESLVKKFRTVRDAKDF